MQDTENLKVSKENTMARANFHLEWLKNVFGRRSFLDMLLARSASSKSRTVIATMDFFTSFCIY